MLPPVANVQWFPRPLSSPPTRVVPACRAQKHGRRGTPKTSHRERRAPRHLEYKPALDVAGACAAAVVVIVVIAVPASFPQTLSAVSCARNGSFPDVYANAALGLHRVDVAASVSSGKNFFKPLL